MALVLASNPTQLVVSLQEELDAGEAEAIAIDN